MFFYERSLSRTELTSVTSTHSYPEDTVSAFQVNDCIHFSMMTPDGRLGGRGRIAKIFPAGNSYWLHVLQDDGLTRMVFEATTTIERLEIESA